MTNYITNDRGERVLACGAPASQARVAVERPELLAEINAIFERAADDPHRQIRQAIVHIRTAGILSPLETASLLLVSNYRVASGTPLFDLITQERRSGRQRIYARLVEMLDQIYDQNHDQPGRRVDLAIDQIRNAGITDPDETRQLLAASRYGSEPKGSVTSLVMAVSVAPAEGGC